MGTVASANAFEPALGTVLKDRRRAGGMNQIEKD
jgi:hypothetical protein